MSLPQDALGGLEGGYILDAELYTDEELFLFRATIPQDALRELERGDYVLNNGEPYTDEDLKQLKEIDNLVKQTRQEQEEWKFMITNSITQMMFVSGETAEPSPETTTIIEEIVREQVVEMVSP